MYLGITCNNNPFALVYIHALSNIEIVHVRIIRNISRANKIKSVFMIKGSMAEKQQQKCMEYELLPYRWFVCLFVCGLTSL